MHLTLTTATRTMSTMLVAACVLLALISIGCSKPQELSYEEEIATWQAERDTYFRESSDSPVPKDQRATFPRLPYFGTNQEYRVPASLSVNRGADALEMPTSTGLRRKMNRVGTLEFTLKGERLKLTAFVEAARSDLNSLFVPFGDRTNGTETYPGGRYLDLERTATGIYDLDFNRAYHPFCLYNPTYDCPIPPRENRLGLPIRAGERLKTED